jgi:hypothetical protein
MGRGGRGRVSETRRAGVDRSKQEKRESNGGFVAIYLLSQIGGAGFLGGVKKTNFSFASRGVVAHLSFVACVAVLQT